MKDVLKKRILVVYNPSKKGTKNFLSKLNTNLEKNYKVLICDSETITEKNFGVDLIIT